MRVTLHRAMLTYADPAASVHTASSGPVAGLDTLYLLVDTPHGAPVVGEVRINCAYLNGYEPDTIMRAAVAMLPTIDWAAGADALLESGAGQGQIAPVRMLLDSLLHDWAAKARGVPVARMLAPAMPGNANGPGGDEIAHATNQTLFLTPMDVFLARAEAYVARGFRDLKVRLGADADDDITRIAALRARFGRDVHIAADANGVWGEDHARRMLDRLATYDLSYVEQPVAPGDWAMLDRVARTSPVAIMLDESVASPADVERIIDLPRTVMAHLKLLKFGGVAPVMAAVRRLRAEHVGFMTGQMNEGGIGTAAVLHVAAATAPDHAELYGADGLSNDPATGVTYGAGMARVSARAGWGVDFNPAGTTLVTEYMVA
ncbi:MAG: mandelate racemase/muconate lactonizing enzyme family protein [Komagataeibacter saccharivorans]|uniref:mandelate racemase/muconate lactonizing enzyme family protein n=1 Tax=Komagataeibacter saccharivorans TaxID=265959 RepID=UPI0039E97D01